jgi:hypothetical protein
MSMRPDGRLLVMAWRRLQVAEAPRVSTIWRQQVVLDLDLRQDEVQVMPQRLLFLLQAKATETDQRQGHRYQREPSKLRIRWRNCAFADNIVGGADVEAASCTIARGAYSPSLVSGPTVAFGPGGSSLNVAGNANVAVAPKCKGAVE